MRPDRIAELLRPFLGCDSSENVFLSSIQLNDISIYIDLLIQWNSRINLTAIRDEEEIVTRHFGESLFAAIHLFPRTVEAGAAEIPQTLADLGSGAGFPGIPIKLWAPELALTLIESNQKKATFLREVVRALSLNKTEIKNTRAERVTERFHIVTLRAVERFENVMPIAAGLLRDKGRLALLISQTQIEQAYAALSKLSWDAPIPIPQSKARVLLVGVQDSGK